MYVFQRKKDNNAHEDCLLIVSVLKENQTEAFIVKIAYIQRNGTHNGYIKVRIFNKCASFAIDS